MPVPREDRIHPPARRDVAREAEERDVLPPERVSQDLFRVEVHLVGDESAFSVLEGPSEEAGGSRDG
jgi:hypothetical protein